MLRIFSIAQLIITAILGCMLVSSPLYGQSESTLKEFFDRKIVVVKIDMPGSFHGVDIYPRRASLIDWKEYRSELKKYGTALHRGQRVTLTKIKAKRKHIEFQLNGGGHGIIMNLTGCNCSEERNSRERDLQSKIDCEDDPERKRELEAELDRLESERRRLNPETMEKRIAWEKGQREGAGSRFNIRYESKLTALDKTPQSVMAALSDYVEFPTEQVGPNVTSGAGQQEAQTVSENLWLERDSTGGRH